MTATAGVSEPWDMEAVDSQASALMQEGIRLLRCDAAEAALIAFDRALALRRRLPIHVPVHAYGLAACWLNRAEALARLDPIHQELALRCYDEALLLLRSLPLEGDVRFPKRLAVAYQNRALVLAERKPPATKAAIAGLGDAIAVLDQVQVMDAAERHYLLAVVWMNLAHIYVSQDNPAADITASHAGQRALALAKAYEQDYAAAAQAALKARLILCQLAARRLSPLTESDALMTAVHDATDLVDDGLRLTRDWERRGVTDLQNLASDLYRFGARVYARYQPQFLSEFLTEQLARI